MSLPPGTVNAANVELEMGVLDGRLLTKVSYDALTEDQVKKLSYLPLPWSLSGNASVNENSDVMKVLLRQVRNLDSMSKALAPDHYADMCSATAPIEITISDLSIVAAFREQLGPWHERHLRHIRDDVYLLDVRFRAGLDDPGAVSNLTVNLQRILEEAIEKGIDLKEIIVVLTHLDAGDLRPSDKLKYGGVSITSPFYSFPKLMAGGQFSAFLDSVGLTDERKTQKGETSLGTLYAFAHRVYAAFLKEGIDPGTLLPHEIENLIRGSLIVQVRDNLAKCLQKLREVPEPMIFTRELKRQAFAEGKALMSEKSVDRYLDLVEGFDTGFSIDDSPMWRAHQSMFRAVGQLPINEATILRRRAYWQKRLEESMKKVLSDEQVQSVANLGGDAMAEEGEEDAVGAQAPPPTVDDIFNGGATEEDDIFTEEQIEAGSDGDGTAQKEVAVLVKAAKDLVLEQDQMALEDDVVTIAEALARRIVEAPESTPALEILSFGDTKLDSTSGYVEISGAYRELAKVIHPDKLPNSTYAGTAFRRINEAKNILLPPSQPPAPPGETPRDFELSTPHVGVADTPTPFSF